MAQARRDAQGQDASQYAHGLWSEAEAKAGEAQAQFAREAYAEASQAFELAATAYRQAQEAAREARVREWEPAERAREQMAQSHRQAQEADAEQYARELWAAADAKSAEARAAFGRRALAHAVRAFEEASLLHHQAAEAARKARQQERRGAEGARGRAVQSRQSASAAGAERHAASVWGQASATLIEAEAALGREQYANAVTGFDGAGALYRQAESEAGEARRRQRAQAEQGRQSMADARRNALALDAASHAEADWNEAEAGGVAAEAAFATQAYAEAGQSFGHASALYRRAEETAREATRRREAERADAEKAREAASLARRAAVEAHVSKYVAEQWNAAEAAQAQASGALSRQEFAAAPSLFIEARRLYAAAAQAARVAADAEARRADAMMGTAIRLLESGDPVGCLRRLNEVLALRPGHRAAAALRLRAEEELRQTDTAVLPAEAAPHDVAETLHAQPRDARGETIQQGETPATVGAEAPPGLTRSPSLPPKPTVLADQRTGSLGVPEVESRGESREGPVVGGGAVRDDATLLVGTDREDATVLAGATAYGETPRPSSVTAQVGDRGPTPVSTHAPSVPGRAAPQPRRLLKAGAFAIGGLAVAAMAIFYLLPGSSRPVSPRVKQDTKALQTVAPPVSPPVQQSTPAQTVAPPVAVARPAASPAPVAPTSSVPRPVAQSPEPPAGGTAEGLRKQVLAAREEAARTDTDRLAPSEFAAAVQKAREGDAALDRQDMAGAQQRYREALEGYRLARAEANRTAALTRTLIETRVVASQAAEARRAAELVDAPRQAPALWTKASSAQDQAEEALKQGEFSRAQVLFIEAEKAYRAAQTAVAGADPRR